MGGNQPAYTASLPALFPSLSTGPRLFNVTLL
jgi:hypothetical protein